MIAEAPSPACNTGATQYQRAQMQTAKAAVKVCAKAEVIGVELHPIIKFACLTR